MKEFIIRFDDFELIAKQQPGGWTSIVHGPGETRVAIKTDEDSAKNACLQSATIMLSRRGTAPPDVLIDPQWNKALVSAF